MLKSYPFNHKIYLQNSDEMSLYLHPLMMSFPPWCVHRFGADHIEGERNKVEQRPDGLSGPAITNTLKKEVGGGAFQSLFIYLFIYFIIH